MVAIASLDDAVAEYGRSLARRPISDNTRKAFVGDARIFARWVGHARRLNAITPDHVRDFLEAQERTGPARSPKSIERRLTSLKVFFDWAHKAGLIAINPAEGVAYRPFLDPLPEYLEGEQVAAVLAAARHVAAGEKLELRPLLAIQLVLDTGIKKGECLALTAEDVVRDPAAPALFVRYAKRHLRYKDRRLGFGADTLRTLEEHLVRKGESGPLFDCTGRNLEYLFNRRVAPLAALASLTFEQMRWTCALRDFREGAMNDEQMQQKYGLSGPAWLEMAAKLARIAPPKTKAA